MIGYDLGTGPLAGPFRVRIHDNEDGPDIDLGRLTDKEYATIARIFPQRTYVRISFLYDLSPDPDKFNPNCTNINPNRINVNATISHRDGGTVLKLARSQIGRFRRALSKRREEERRLEDHTREDLTFFIYRRDN